ncbi:unnamed protein product [Acanthoscelides obtectus]|uniref:Aquaporin n=1 Tax=Acanthoscelides obtectus TaxID=200917 RepID=A0A9P0Q8V0_ACAOB|nr:unnamed protein product [Acanthoscelides obtectus]CAK1666792.1 Aquaporin-11 [Acanthoscelides obtectus]
MKCYIVFFKKNAGEMVKASTQPKTRARPIGFGRRVYKFFKNVGLLGFSKRNNIYGVHPLIISTAYIILTLLLAAISRKVVKLIFGDSESLVKQILLEFIATLELCAACFELIIVADNWGVGAYALYLFLLTIWWSLKWEDASACPYAPLEQVFEGSKNVKTALLIVISQVLAALVTFRYVQVLWALELTETHQGKAYEDCTADLQVDMITGAIIEAVATCLCRLVSRTLSETEARLSTVFDAFFGTAMVVLGKTYVITVIRGGFHNHKYRMCKL